MVTSDSQYTMLLRLIILVATTRSLGLVKGFAPIVDQHHRRRPTTATSTTATSLSMNFFKDLVGKAFENDGSLDKDKSKGQYDGPMDEYDDDGVAAQRPELTMTQQKWREAQQRAAGVVSSPTALLTGSTWKLDLFLTGIPDRDPSNDLFGSKVNISSRDRKVGLMVPEEPTVGGVVIRLLENGVCQIVEPASSDEQLQQSEFIDSNALDEGEWRVSDDGAMIRISLNVMGYQRTVQTRGTIQKVYWSQEDDVQTSTSSAYTIPAGAMYGDAGLSSGAQVGTLQWSDGILRVEQSSGLLGAGSKMVPCGRFTATRVD